MAIELLENIMELPRVMVVKVFLDVLLGKITFIPVDLAEIVSSTKTNGTNVDTVDLENVLRLA